MENKKAFGGGRLRRVEPEIQHVYESVRIEKKLPKYDQDFTKKESPPVETRGLFMVYST